MRFIVLDISGSTGWALFDTDHPTNARGMEQQSALQDYGVIKISKPARDYAEHPWGYHNAAKDLAEMLMGRIRSSVGPQDNLDMVVVEETNGARARFTQKFLEYCHYAFLDSYVEAFSTFKGVCYINTSEWRRVTDCHLTREEKNQNARLSRHKRKAKGAGKKLDKKALGIAGRITIKHVAIRRVRELYGLNLLAKDDDIADAILIGHAYLNGARLCTGTEER